MTPLPVLSSHKVVKTLSRVGFVIKRQSGSHIHLWHEIRKTLVTVPNHDELVPGTLHSIIRQAKTDSDEFLLYIE